MNSFGRLFRISIFGESHGPTVGVLLDGCPAGIPIQAEDFQEDMDRRKGQGKGSTSRREADQPKILSGVFNKMTTGAPLAIVLENADIQSNDYEAIKQTPRPGHADLTAHKKFNGFNDPRGGGHFSGRLTAGLTAAGVVAKKIIQPVSVQAWVTEAGGKNDIEKAVEEAFQAGDSIGGIIECNIENLPAGLGEPFFDSCESLFSHFIFSIPGIKGIEFGSGFEAARMRGSQHNDPILDASGKTATNRSGGINGGLTNSNPIVFRVAVKPTPSILLPQKTVNIETGEPTEITVQGRHDTCIALRAPVVVEAAAAIVLADLKMIEKSGQ